MLRAKAGECRQAMKMTATPIKREERQKPGQMLARQFRRADQDTRGTWHWHVEAGDQQRQLWGQIEQQYTGSRK
jgi:hypothetical protein